MKSPNTSSRSNLRGFTLIELLVVTAIFSVLVTLGLLMSFETFRGTLHRSEVATIVSLLEKARSRSMSNIEQSSWGVCYLSGNYLLLKGSSVCDAAYAREKISANPSVAAASDFSTTFPVVVFAQLSGDSNSPVPFAVVEDSRTTTVTINYAGTILW